MEKKNNFCVAVIHPGKEVRITSKWFTANNLLLKQMCFMPNVKIRNVTLHINNEALEFAKSTIFLGLTLDNKLQWKSHIDTLSGRLSSAAYAIKKIRGLTNVETARMVYYSYFHSIMSYGLMLWGSAADVHDIFVIQKRAVRAIYGLGSRVSLRDHFKNINILTVASQYIYLNLIHIYKHRASYLKSSDNHHYNTRNKDRLVNERFRLTKVKSSFVGNCVAFFNKIPEDLQNLPLNQFKNTIKSKLISKAYYTINEYLDDKTPWTN